MSKFRLLDYHMHTAVTVDGKMNEVQACEQALVMGLSEIAFTNHVMLKQPDFLMTPESFVSHWQQVRECQQRYPQLTIRLGIEIDYYRGWERRIADTLASYQDRIGRKFDLVIGAIHEMNDIFFSNQKHAPELYASADLATLYREYFTLSGEAAGCGLFDILAHPDLIKRYNHELTPPLDFEAYRPAVAAFVEQLLDAGVGIDVNMKGMKLKVGEPFPSRDFLAVYLERARARQIEPVLTLGSDAHNAADVGANLREGAAMLLDLGHGMLSSFEQRQRRPFPIVTAG
jgi:histidinol-phosphatase (PHP family)